MCVSVVLCVCVSINRFDHGGTKFSRLQMRAARIAELFVYKSEDELAASSRWPSGRGQSTCTTDAERVWCLNISNCRTKFTKRNHLQKSVELDVAGKSA